MVRIARWQREGVWDQVLAALRMQMRTKQSRDPELIAQAPSTVNPSKPVPFEAQKKASTTEKKIWGRKRHALVDTEGQLLAVKVRSAEDSDQQGGKLLLTGLKDRFPRMQLVWADSHYGGTMLDWVKEHLGWTVEVVRQLKEPKRGLLVAEEEEIDWDKLAPYGVSPPAQKMGHRAQLCLDGALASPLPRS